MILPCIVNKRKHHRSLFTLISQNPLLWLYPILRYTFFHKTGGDGTGKCSVRISAPHKRKYICFNIQFIYFFLIYILYRGALLPGGLREMLPSYKSSPGFHNRKWKKISPTFSFLSETHKQM